MSTIQFEGAIEERPADQERIRMAIQRVEKWQKQEVSPRWVVVTHEVPLGDSVYVAHAARRDWTVTARSVDELEDKLIARAEGGPSSGRAVQPSPFRSANPCDSDPL